MSCPFMRAAATGATCPLGFGSANAELPPGHPPLPKPQPLPAFTLEGLLQAVQPAAGAGTQPAASLVAVKGCVYDVSSDPRFSPGGRWHCALGRDLTRTLAFEPVPALQPLLATTAAPPAHAPLLLAPEHQGSTALAGLSFDSLRTLETWAACFAETCTLVGRLKTMEEVEAEEGGRKLVRPGEEEMQPMPSDIYGSFLPLQEEATNGGETQRSLHQLLDADDQEGCRSLIESLPDLSPQLNQPCHRSEMMPIHKVIEKGWADVLQALLSKHARTDVPCALYDGDTPLQLAKRFQFDEGVRLLQQTLADGL